MKSRFLIILVFWSFVVSAQQNLRISLFDKEVIKSCVFELNRGTYSLRASDEKTDSITNYFRCKLKIEVNKFNNLNYKVLNYKDSLISEGVSSQLKLTGLDYLNSFKITVNGEQRLYDDDLEFKVSNGEILIVNDVDLDHYVAGVVESEAGLPVPLEYFKLQAILCRTYSLNNKYRHQSEGFNLCDNVHCQAYYNKSTRFRNILMGTAATSGLVVIDKKLDLINSTFHSNCGGHTCNSEDVWRQPLSYLKATPDTFCVSERHATWEKKVSLTEWEAYLNNKGIAMSDSVVYHNMTSNCEEERQFFLPNSKIKTSTVRFDFNLNSAYYDIDTYNDTVHFVGRGFGHGVGLCQEGGIRMAELGYTYKEIIKFYFSDVHIVSLQALVFFRQEF